MDDSEQNNLVLHALMKHPKGMPLKVKYRGVRSFARMPLHRLNFGAIRSPKDINGAVVRHLVRSLLDDLNMRFEVKDWTLSVELREYDEENSKLKRRTEESVACLDWQFWEHISLLDIERERALLVLETHLALKELKGMHLYIHRMHINAHSSHRESECI